MRLLHSVHFSILKCLPPVVDLGLLEQPAVSHP